MESTTAGDKKKGSNPTHEETKLQEAFQKKNISLVNILSKQEVLNKHLFNKLTEKLPN